MKKLLTVLLGLMVAQVSWGNSNGQVATVNCDLSKVSGSNIDAIELVSTRTFTSVQAPVPGGLLLTYDDGTQESLQPIPKTDIFGNLVFQGEMPFKKGSVFFQGAQTGDIYIDMECYYAPNIPWGRCQSQGSGEHGQYSGVKMNIDGLIIRFLGNNLCQRSVEEF